MPQAPVTILHGKRVAITDFNQMTAEGASARRTGLSGRIDLVIIRFDALVRNGGSENEMTVHKATLTTLKGRILPDVATQRDFQTVEEKIMAFERIASSREMFLTNGRMLEETIYR